MSNCYNFRKNSHKEGIFNVCRTCRIRRIQREAARDEIYYSTISIWEAAIKRLVHPDKITKLTPKELADFCYDAKIYELPLRLEHVYTLETLTRLDDTPPHKDPFDRILISQAKSEHMTFITHDDRLNAYNEPCILYV